jgi:predicted nucleic acid-binding protein
LSVVSLEYCHLRFSWGFVQVGTPNSLEKRPLATIQGHHQIVQRLKQQPACAQQLRNFRQAIEQVPQLGIAVLAIPPGLIATAAAISQQTGLLSNDALIVAVMQANGLTHLASSDTDFDRVPGITRYAPS